MITIKFNNNGYNATHDCPVFTYNEAEALVKNIYGDNITITGWDNKDQRSTPSRSLWGLF